MATKTATKKRSTKGTKPRSRSKPAASSEANGNGSTLDVPKMQPKTFPVRFGRLSIGTGTLRLPFKLNCGSIGTQAARELLCERRLNVILKTGDGQPRLDFDRSGESADTEVSGSADTKGLTISSGNYASGLTFNRNDIDQEALIPLVETEGRLTILDVSDIPEDDKPQRGRPPKDPERDVDVEEGKNKPIGQPALEAVAALRREGAELEAIGLKPPTVKALVAANVRTVEELEQFGERGQLVPGVTKGLGEKALAEIEATYRQHRGSEFIEIPINSSDKHDCTLVVRRDGEKWRASWTWHGPQLRGQDADTKKFASRKAAIESAVGSIIDAWSQHTGATWKAATDDLRAFLRGMEST